jgi:AcrR family transcriptional regulator
MSKPANPELVRRILDIALEELGAKPPDKVNMRLIAQRAGVSPTAIYYYFASKEALFERIKFNAMEELDDRIGAAQNPEAAPRERLSSLIREYAAWCLERPHLARLLMEELPAQVELSEESMRKYYATFFRARDLVEEAIAEGSLEERDVLLDVSVAQAAIWGIVSQFRSKRVHPAFWGSVDPLIDRFIGIYLGNKGEKE